MTFLKTKCLLLTATLIVGLTFCQIANAHFLFAYSDDGKIKVVFGEGLEPDQAQFLSGLKDMKSFTTVDGTAKEIALKKVTQDDDGWFEIAEDSVGDNVDISCPYGVFSRGDKSMYLDYSAKYARLTDDSPSLKPSKELTLDLVPEFDAGKLKLTTYFKGLPLSHAEVKLMRVETDSLETETDETGTVLLKPAARYLVRAKHVVEESGEVDGKKFSQRNYYCTLVLDYGDQPKTEKDSAASAPAKKPNASISLKKVEAKLPDFPRGITSFGAAVVDDNIYVIGGKSGKAHSYATAYQNRDVFRLNLTGDKNEWKSVSDNLGLQGLAIVGHEGKIYRIGGLEARNKEGEEHDLHSIAEFLEFNPADKTWKEMPSLPEGRSSFDACVADGKVFVVGGWTMDGEEESVWAEDMLVFDLTKPDGQWQRIEAPFTTRALAVRQHGKKLIVVGGIENGGGPTSSVHFFDLASEQWSEGPEVPTESGMKAFGCSAVEVAGEFLVSTYDGSVFCLSDDAKAMAACAPSGKWSVLPPNAACRRVTFCTCGRISHGARRATGSRSFRSL